MELPANREAQPPDRRVFWRCRVGPCVHCRGADAHAVCMCGCHFWFLTLSKRQLAK